MRSRPLPSPQGRSASSAAPSMAPHTLLIDRGERISPSISLAWPRIRSVIAHQWELELADLAWICRCPPEAITISRCGPIHIAHGGLWARARELESLRWALVDPLVISGTAMAIRPDHERPGCWRALTSWEASNALLVLQARSEPITQPCCCRWSRLRMQLSGPWLSRISRAATTAERERILCSYAQQRQRQRLSCA